MVGVSSTHGPRVLAVNSGSSSLKVGLFVRENEEVSQVLEGSAAGIGSQGGSLRLVDAEGKVLADHAYELPTQKQALAEMLRAIGRAVPGAIEAVGHRVVHGGPHLLKHQRITPEVEKTLEASVHFAPLHIPPALNLIRQTEALMPGVLQFACFDTAFHTTLPEVARHYALPQEYYDEGMRRYGFHGLSYESIVERLRGESDLPSRLICAHLGSGASITAICKGKSVDTSMGLTPVGGFPMSTRSGDLDPGVLLFLMRNHGMSADDLEDMLNHRAGLYALSGGVTDMRRLEEARSNGDSKATLAVEAFAMGVRKFVGAYAAVLGGVDLMVFTGGIGEHSSGVRRLCCTGLEALGIGADDAADGKGKVRVMQAEEEKQIARHCFAMLAG